MRFITNDEGDDTDNDGGDEVMPSGAGHWIRVAGSSCWRRDRCAHNTW